MWLRCGARCQLKRREAARQWTQKTIRLTNLEGKADMRLMEGKKVATTLVRAAAEYDLIVL